MKKDYFEKFVLQNIKKNIIPKNKKILITGSNGFIGRYLVYVLANIFKSHNNLIYGIDINKNLNFSKNYIYLKKDLALLKKRHLPSIKFDYVIHLAGIPSPVYYKKFPLKTIYLNAELSRELMEISKKDGSNFTYFSSSEIYGNPDPLNIPTKETYNGYVSSIGDRSCYDESKRLGETICYLFKNNENKKVKIIRPFNYYGDYMRQNDNRIIPKFMSQAIKNEDITIFGSGKQTRAYCYIDDAITMIKDICLEGKHFVYNVGKMDEEISAKNLAERVLKTVPNSKSKLVQIDYPNEYPKDEPMRRCPNIDKYLKEFKQKPSVGIDKGLENFYQYAKKNWL